MAPCCAGFDIVIVTLDSVSAGRLDAALARDPRSLPNMAALARAGVKFDNIYAPLPASAQSLLATLTGRYAPPMRRATDAVALRDREIETFAEALGRSGYRTALYMSGDLINYSIGAFLDAHPFDRVGDNSTIACPPARRRLLAGYNHLGDDCLARNGLDWLQQDQGQPSLLWLWFAGTHFPYHARDNAVDPRIGHPQARFAGSLREADRVIGGVIAQLQRTGRWNRTLFVLTADHGESFGERGLRLHGTALFDEQTRVPLIVANLPAPDGVAGQVGSPVDLGPTLLARVGATQRGTVHGRDLLTIDPRRRAYFALQTDSPQLGYRQGRHKILLNSNGRQLERYDMLADPWEVKPLALSEAERSAAYRRLLGFGWIGARRPLQQASTAQPARP